MEKSTKSIKSDKFSHINSFTKYLVIVLLFVLPLIGFAVGKEQQLTISEQMSQSNRNSKVEIDSNSQFIKIGNTVFDLSKTSDREIDTPQNTNWLPVLNLTTEIGQKSSLFDYKFIPDAKMLLFTLASEPELFTSEDSGTLYKTYIYANQKAMLVYQGIWPNPSHFSVPRIAEVSSDGQYIKLDLLGCWDCGGHDPESLIIDTKHFDNNVKNLGKTDGFSWGLDGKYTYQVGGQQLSGSLKY